MTSHDHSVGVVRVVQQSQRAQPARRGYGAVRVVSLSRLLEMTQLQTPLSRRFRGDYGAFLHLEAVAEGDPQGRLGIGRFVHLLSFRYSAWRPGLLDPAMAAPELRSVPSSLNRHGAKCRGVVRGSGRDQTRLSSASRGPPLRASPDFLRSNHRDEAGDRPSSVAAAR